MTITGAELILKFAKGRADDIAIAVAKNEQTANTDAGGSDLAPNPIFVKDGKFFFYDETWTNEYGPYDTREQAQTALQKYSESLG